MVDFSKWKWYDAMGVLPAVTGSLLSDKERGNWAQHAGRGLLSGAAITGLALGGLGAAGALGGGAAAAGGGAAAAGGAAAGAGEAGALGSAGLGAAGGATGAEAAGGMTGALKTFGPSFLKFGSSLLGGAGGSHSQQQQGYPYSPVSGYQSSGGLQGLPPISMSRLPMSNDIVPPQRQPMYPMY